MQHAAELALLVVEMGLVTASGLEFVNQLRPRRVPGAVPNRDWGNGKPIPCAVCFRFWKSPFRAEAFMATVNMVVSRT
jgi:hypothetical protein